MRESGAMLTNERRSGFTLVELLVVIAIIGALAGLVAPQVLGAKKKAERAQCLNNVRNIGGLCNQFADDEDNRGIFPFGKGSAPMAFESFQVLVDAEYQNIKPNLFICPSSLDNPAEPDDNGHFELDENSCSYAYIAKKKKNTSPGNTILLADDSVADPDNDVEENHVGGVNVYYLDSSASFLKKEKFEDRDLPKGLVGNGN